MYIIPYNISSQTIILLLQFLQIYFRIIYILMIVVNLCRIFKIYNLKKEYIFIRAYTYIYGCSYMHL
jgi:hypothetical protein